jgi:hypothetical protein
MRVACEFISQRTRYRFHDVYGWAKAVSLWITDVQVDDAATFSLESLGGTDKVTDRVVKVSGSIRRRDHSQFSAQMFEN